MSPPLRTRPLRNRRDGRPAERSAGGASGTSLGFRSLVHVNEKGGRFGGTEEYLALLTDELTAHGVRSHLVCGIAGAAPHEGLASVDVVEGLADRACPLGVGRRVADAVARLSPDVVYLHNLFDADVVRCLAALPDRPTLLWYVHDHYLTCLSELRWRQDLGTCPVRLGDDCLGALAEGHCVLRFADGRFDADDLARRQALSAALREVDAVVVVSEYMRATLAEAQPTLEGRIHLLPRPVRTRRPPARARRRRQHRPPGRPAVVAFAGRITPEKGLATLIDALAAGRSGRAAELLVAGVAEHAGYHAHCVERAERAARSNPDLEVRWLGHLDYAGVDALLASSDVVAVPSEWPEPLGAIALEALAAGAAVVASRVGGLDTYLVSGRNCLLAEPGDVGGWTVALDDLLERPDKAARLAAQGRIDVAGLTVGAHLDELAAIIRNAGSRAGAPA